MAKSVTTIPATLSRFTAAPINSTKKRRVAAYARVSTDNEEQLTSYEAQILGQMYHLCDSTGVDPETDVTISWGNGILYDEDQAWTDYKAMVAAGMLKPEIALGWYFDMPTETPEDLAAIREKYMPEEIQTGDEDGI